MHQSSLDKMEKFKENYLDPTKQLRILDIGSKDVNGTYAPLFKEHRWTYHGADMTAGVNVDIVLDNPYNWQKINSNSYDVVISGQTFEHIEFFWITMLQVNRILKMGGVSCIIAPSSGHEHSYPTDCWRFYPDGIRAIAKWAKMEILEATTQLENQNYTDGSDEWKDSMLVCKKKDDVKEISTILELLNQWIGIKDDSMIKQMFEKTSQNKNENLDKQKPLQIFEHVIKKKWEEGPRWHEALAYLIAVYCERADLISEFPEVEDRGDFTKLFRWANDFGTKEDSRLKSYSSFYKKFSNR